MLRVSPLAYKGETSLFIKGRFFLLVLSLSKSVVLGDSLGQSFNSPEQCLGVEVLLVHRCILEINVEVTSPSTRETANLF